MSYGQVTEDMAEEEEDKYLSNKHHTSLEVFLIAMAMGSRITARSVVHGEVDAVCSLDALEKHRGNTRQDGQTAHRCSPYRPYLHRHVFHPQ